MFHPLSNINMDDTETFIQTWTKKILMKAYVKDSVF